MYEILLDGKTLYYPGDEICSLTSAVLHQTIGDSGYLNITVPKENPMWDSFKERDSILTVLKDNVEIFCGEVRETGKSLSLDRTVYAVGELSYLLDSIQPQHKYTGSGLDAFVSMLSNHNATMSLDTRKQFTQGVYTITDSITERNTNYGETLTEMRDKLCGENGYLRVRKANGNKYLDLVTLADYGKVCGQPIKFGRNLLDYTDSITTDSIATVVIPLGQKTSSGVVGEMDTYLTISSVNDGKDYLVNDSGVNEFGVIKKVVNYDDITDASNLKSKGQQWLTEYQYKDLSITVNAVDLSVLDVNVDSIDVGDKVKVIAKPFALDSWYYITEKETDILNLANNSITIGNSVKVNYTKAQAKITGTLEEEMPDEEDFLAKAKTNATNLLGLGGGYIKYKYTNDGKPSEMLIMNTPNESTATKIWRWNQNGLGYSKDGGQTYGLAMTSNGAIVADFITTGTMSCSRLNGGVITGQSISGGTVSGTTISGGSLTGTNIYVDGSTIMSTDYNFQIQKQSDGHWFLHSGSGWFDESLISKNALSAYADRHVYIYTNLTVSGTKSRVADTETYGNKLLYCLETPTPMFSDLGEGEIDESGECQIWIDDEFFETVDTECEYQVFLQKYGIGDCYVTERENGYFTVCGTPGLAFGWEIKAIQRGFDTMRLDDFEEPSSEMDSDIYDEDAFDSDEEQEEFGEDFDYLFDLIDSLEEDNDNE